MDVAVGQVIVVLWNCGRRAGMWAEVEIMRGSWREGIVPYSIHLRREVWKWLICV